ncbi:L,D-transpeptidase [Actinomadura barringtoniae]|uniref:L,D-transpeptidase n=1 Tax=Actinomadura barringtoniae TaxID=1427535 RepID=UPI0027DCAE6E|nr:L,D-transpeptidase [Actinomadura barringtoniae]
MSLGSQRARINGPFPLGAAAAVAVALLASGCGGSKSAGAEGNTSSNAAKLPQTTTYTTVKSLPLDSGTDGGDGTVVRPAKDLPISATPGGPAVATLPTTQLGGPTWVPVVESKPGWRRVLLPSRPNRATGWVPDNGGLTVARSPYTIKVDLSDRKLTLAKAGKTTGAWKVAVGDAKTPTPTGRTFLLALLKPAKPTFSPLILPVGTHSATLDSFGGGPGTVAFHGWTDKAVFGKAVTHGCVRVPADALTQLSSVALGTPVLITD